MKNQYSDKVVKVFNEIFPKGSTVMHRNVGIKSFLHKERVVSTKAFISDSGEPVVFFKGLSSYYSILPEFVDYHKGLDTLLSLKNIK